MLRPSRIITTLPPRSSPVAAVARLSARSAKAQIRPRGHSAAVASSLASGPLRSNDRASPPHPGNNPLSQYRRITGFGGISRLRGRPRWAVNLGPFDTPGQPNARARPRNSLSLLRVTGVLVSLQPCGVFPQGVPHCLGLLVVPLAPPQSPGTHRIRRRVPTHRPTVSDYGLRRRWQFPAKRRHNPARAERHYPSRSHWGRRVLAS